MSIRTLLSLLLLLVLVAAAASAPAQEDPWTPTIAEHEKLDWIMLSSGEWLLGEFHLLRDDAVEFESEELDNLNFDWGDIAVLRTPRILTFTFDDDVVMTGSAFMEDGIIRIQSGDQVREMPRTSLLSIIEGRPTELNYWSAKISLGLLLRSGNTDQNDFNTIVLIRRQSMRSRFDLEYKGNVSKVNDVETVNNHLGTALVNYLVTRGFFVTPVAGELYSDRFQNFDLRATLGAGVGYFVYRRPKLEWQLGLSGGYQHTTFISVEEGADKSSESAVLIPSTGLETDVTSDLELTFQFNSQITLPDTDGTVYHSFLLFSYEWTSLFDFDFSVTWDRVQNPVPKEDGTVPQKDDFRLSFGLGLDL
jgi:hypothetical protein